MLLCLILITLLCALLLFIPFIWKQCRLYYYGSKIKGPWGWPIIGSALECAKYKKNYFDLIQSWCAQYRPIFKFWILNRLYIVLTEPDDLEQVMRINLNKGDNYDFLKSGFGNGLFLSPAEQWKVHRKFLNKAFNQSALNEYIQSLVQSANKTVQYLDEHLSKNYFDMFEVFFIGNSGTIADIAGGLKVEEWELETKSTKFMRQACDNASDLLLNPLYHLGIGWKLTGSYKAILDCRKNIIEKIIPTIEARRAMKISRDKEIFLDLLLEMKENGLLKNDEEIIGEIITLFLASTDTTACNLSFVTIILALYQDVQEKLYQEQLSIFKNNDNNITHQDLDKMDYLERVIKETQRVFPVTPVLLRSMDEDYVLDKILIPKGSTLIVPIKFVHQDPKYWPDPMKFDPDRFLPEEVEKRPRYSHMPYSIPPRNCIGWKIGEMWMKLILSAILRNFKITSTQYKSIEDVKVQTKVLIEATNGYGVTFERRQNKIVKLK